MGSELERHFSGREPCKAFLDLEEMPSGPAGHAGTKACRGFSRGHCRLMLNPETRRAP